jgi:ATP-binding cassette subfamily A (ABC1) protein 3
MMFFNVVFWGILGMWLDQVVPSQFGIAKPLCFCFMRRRRGGNINDADRQRLLDDDEIGGKDRRNFEMVSDSLKKQEKEGKCLKVRGLVKKFGNKTAVKGTSLTMYQGQIFALLGHNGAGKTTTISMLTGLIEPNEGAAEVFDIDIFNNMDEMRKILGVCPQHDVLFEFLTAEDHLKLFAAFKGTSANLIDDQVKKMLHDIDLYDVKDQLSKTLSGGQKRKLSVAIAMIGNSKIVMLDEPTSGMDTTARRKLWEMLKKNKAGRIVILTTHYMDEADILGDRIAIMAEGDVQCTGSSLFLKNRYGVGYNLVIAKKTR